MIEIILTIVLWIIIGIGALYAFLNIFFIITSKEFRKEFWTETKRKVKEQKKKTVARMKANIINARGAEISCLAGIVRYEINSLFAIIYNVLLLGHKPLVTRFLYG